MLKKRTEHFTAETNIVTHTYISVWSLDVFSGSGLVHFISMIHSSQLRFTAMVCAAVMLSVLVGLDHCTDSEMEEEDLAVSFASALLGFKSYKMLYIIYIYIYISLGTWNMYYINIKHMK